MPLILHAQLHNNFGVVIDVKVLELLKYCEVGFVALDKKGFTKLAAMMFVIITILILNYLADFLYNLKTKVFYLDDK